MRLELEPSVTTFPLAQTDIREDAFASTSWDFDSLLKKGVAAAQSGDRDGARKLLSQATAINPATEDAWMWLASISDYPEELLAFLNRVLEINPANDKAAEWRSATKSLLATTFVQRALAARNDGSLDLAEQCLDQALVHDNDCESAWFWKASLAKSDDLKLEHLARVLSINAENTAATDAVAEIKHSQVVASLEKANMFALSGDSESAMAILNDLVGHESTEIRESAWMTMCDVAESDELKLEYLNNVLDVNPENLEAADALKSLKRSRSMAAFDEAKAAAAAGEREKAIEVLDGFVKDVPDSVDAWLLKSHLSNGLEQKIEALEKALEIDPDNAAARSGLAFLALTFGSSSQAETEGTVVDDRELQAESRIAPGEEFADALVEESMEFSQMDDEVQFAYRPTEETLVFDESPSEPEFSAYEQDVASEPDGDSVMPEPVDEFVMPQPAPSYDLSTRPEPSRLGDEIFGTVAEQADPSSETVDSLSTFVQPVLDQDPFAAETPASPFDHVIDGPFAATTQESPQIPTNETVVLENCPFCASPNDAQAFECGSCRTTLTLSDIEKLLSGTSADREAVQHAVTAMEAEWNTREFSETEFSTLAVGHFNLGNNANGFRYLQEASRLNPNNVILSGQVNTIAIRLDEMRRQSEVSGSMVRGKRILVVDDSPTVRKLISGKLEKSGHHVVCAIDGVDALAKIDEEMPDLVLLDITMPRMDGYEVCKHIRANPRGKDLPVVMISGKDGFFDKVRGRMAGTSGYVTKPFGPETLMKALETYLLPDEVEAV